MAKPTYQTRTTAVERGAARARSPGVVENLTPAEKRWFSSLTPHELDDLAEGGIRVKGGKVYYDDFQKARDHFEEIIISNDPRYGPKPADWIRTPPSIFSGKFLEKSVPIVKRVAAGGAKAVPLLGLAAEFADIPEAQASTMGSEFESAPEARARQQRDIESEQFLAEQPPSGMARFAGPEGGERYAAERFGTSNDQEPIDMALQPTPEDITGGEVHIEEEDALLEKATQADDAMDEALLAAAPAGDFSAPALNALVEALNEVLPVMGLEDPYPTFEEDIEGTVPVEFVKYLTMVSAAATDAGLDRFAVKLEDIGNDTDLMKAAGQLDVLSKNDSFRSFMATTGREEAAAESDSTPVDFVPTPAPPTEDVESVLEARA